MTIGIMLAAGAGSRFGGDKLLAPLHGRPLVLHAVDALRPAVTEIIAVVRPGDGKVPDRIAYINPDCGFWMLKRSVADRKIRALVAGRNLFEGL